MLVAGVPVRPPRHGGCCSARSPGPAAFVHSLGAILGGILVLVVVLVNSGGITERPGPVLWMIGPLLLTGGLHYAGHLPGHGLDLRDIIWFRHGQAHLRPDRVGAVARSFGGGDPSWLPLVDAGDAGLRSDPRCSRARAGHAAAAWLNGRLGTFLNFRFLGSALWTAIPRLVLSGRPVEADPSWQWALALFTPSWVMVVMGFRWVQLPVCAHLLNTAVRAYLCSILSRHQAFGSTVFLA